MCSLENLFLIPSQVSTQRNSINNFCSAQTSKLHQLSSDATQFIETCRSAVEAGLTKNNGLAEQMSDLLQQMASNVSEWQSNNENMKTIAPTLLQSVEMVNNATKDQITNVVDFNEENEKLSTELNNELTAVSNVIREHTEANQNDIARLVESVNGHTDHFSVSLTASKIKCVEHFEMHKKLAATQLKNIEGNVVDGITNVISSATNIVEDIKLENFHLKEDVNSYLNANTKLKTIATRLSTSAREKLCDWRNVLRNFHKNELKTYTSTG